MKLFSQTVIILSAAIVAGGVLRAETVVEPRYDQSVLTADFEGDWAGLPVESTSENAEVVVFKQEAPAAPLVPVAPQYPDPLFVSYPLHPTGRTVVFGVAEATGTDVVLLDNGYDQGFRTGMLCEISSADQPVGEIILVEVRADRAAGLITQLNEGSVIRYGDAVRIKTVQYL